MSAPRLARALAPRLPFFYGWVVAGCAMCAAFARQGSAVATLSVFITPMTETFGWSRTAMSGAVSLGGVLAALLAPALGAVVDRHGTRAVLTASALVVAAAALALAATPSIAWFYAAFAIGRMTFAAPFEIGIAAAVANWFVARRARVMAIVILVSGIGLAVMPLLAQLVIDGRGWRAGWVAIAIVVATLGAGPGFLLLVRRPEDLGLRPDGAASRPVEPAARSGHAPAAPGEPEEPAYTLAEALRTPTLWALMAFTAVIFAVQAGVSLHQAPHLVQRGIPPTVAASVVSTFSLLAALGGLAFGLLGDRIPIRAGLAAAAAAAAAGGYLMHGVAGAAQAYAAAALFGAGVGGVLTLIPVAFAAYYGRRHFGAIRGAALTVQVTGQAAGPLLAGALFDATGSYHAPLALFTLLALAAAGLALAARPPPAPG